MAIVSAIAPVPGAEYCRCVGSVLLLRRNFPTRVRKVPDFRGKNRPLLRPQKFLRFGDGSGGIARRFLQHHRDRSRHLLFVTGFLRLGEERLNVPVEAAIPCLKSIGDVRESDDLYRAQLKRVLELEDVSDGIGNRRVD